MLLMERVVSRVAPFPMVQSKTQRCGAQGDTHGGTLALAYRSLFMRIGIFGSAASGNLNSAVLPLQYACGMAAHDASGRRAIFGSSLRPSGGAAWGRGLTLLPCQRIHGKAVSPRCGAASFSGGSGVALFRASRADPNEALGSVRGAAGAPGWQAKLKSFGLAGLLAYGLLNTLYYTAVFLLVWKSVKVPRGLGMAASARKFVEVFCLTWAGSQITKAARIGGAVLLAPIVGRILDFVQRIFKLRSRRSAFLLIVSSCVGTALALFGGIVFVHA